MQKRKHYVISSTQIFLIVLLLIVMVSLCVLPVLAATTVTGHGVSGLTVSYEDTSYNTSSYPADAWTSGTSSLSWSGTTKRTGNFIQGYTYNYRATTLTITNNSEAAKVLSFDYSVTINGGSVSIDNTSVTSDASFSKMLNNGDSITITTSSSAFDTKTTTVSLTNIKLEVQQVAVTFSAPTNGTYTVNGSGIDETTTQTVESTTAFALVATPNENYVFNGWYVDGTLYSTEKSLSAAVFASGGTVTTEFGLDPLYSVATTAEDSSYTKDQLVVINSRYYHSHYTDILAGNLDGGKNDQTNCYYSITSATNTNDDYRLQRIPSLQWAVSDTGINVARTGTAQGEYDDGAGNSWWFINMVSDVIRIYAKEDCTISFTYTNAIDASDSERDTDAYPSCLRLYDSTNAAVSYETVLAAGTKYTDKNASTPIEYTLSKGHYLYIYTNGLAANKELKLFPGYATHDFSYSASITDFTVSYNETKYTQTTTFQDNLGNALAGGSLTVSGTTYTPNSSGAIEGLTFPGGTTMTMSQPAAPNNYRFMGWSVNGSMVYTSTYTYALNADTIVNPVFVPNYVTFDADAGTYQYLDINGNTVSCSGEYVARNEDCTKFYSTIAEAFADTDVTVLLGDVTINGNFEIPEGETLVVPHALSGICATLTDGSYVPSTIYSGGGQYAALTVNGNVSVNGTLLAAGAQYAPNGTPAGTYGTLTVAGTVTVNNGGKLYCYGLANGTGTIYVKSGAQAHELLAILDIPHPQTLQSLVQKSEDYRIFPFTTYHINTLETKTVYEAGSTLDGHYSVEYDDIVQGTMPFIGSSASVFILKQGTVTKYFDSDEGQIVFRVDEGATLETGEYEMSLTVKFNGITYDGSIASNEYIMPMNSAYSIKIAGNATFSHDYKLLPGSKLDVESTGTLTIASGADLIFYRLNDYDYRGSKLLEEEAIGFDGISAYPLAISRYTAKSTSSIGSAKLNVDGTLITNGGLYVTDCLIAENTDETDTYKNYTYYDNGYNYLTGFGMIDMGSATSGLEKIHENAYCYVDHAIQLVEVTVSPMKGLPADATADEAAQYESLTGINYGTTNTKGLNVWGGAPCAEGHTEGLAVTENNIDPTCTDAGSYDSVVYCAVCEAELSRTQKTVPANGHSYTAVVTKPTCTEGGYTTYNCKNCSDSYTANEVDASGHSWAEASCNNPKTCSVCRETDGEATGHTVVTDAAVDATCTATGLTEGSHCSVCNEVLTAQTVVDALGHTEVIDAAVDATCTATGLTEGKHCSVCNEVIVAQTVVDALGHTEVVDAAVAATCTATGLTEGKHCSVCNEVLTAQTVVDALGHTEVIDAAVAATCTAAGKTAGKHCSVCNEVIVGQEVVDALGHTEVIDAAVDATCTATGLTEGKHCSVCNEVIVAQNVVAAKGHTEVTDAAVDATCTATGLTEGSHCSVCNEVLVAQTVVDALGHTDGEAVVENKVDATCSAAGSYDTVVYCSVCDAEQSRETVTVDALGHDYVDGVCSVCNVSEHEHKYDQLSYNADGHWYECSCGDTTEIEEHSFGDWIIDTAATSTTTGLKHKECCCKYSVSTVIPQILKVNNVSLTLQNRISINFKSRAYGYGYTEPYLVVTRGTEVTEITEYTVDEDNRYVFTFEALPQHLNDTLEVYLYANHNGEPYCSDKLEYSFTTYCYSQLGKTTDTKLQTMLVDLLNYATAAQQYRNYNLDNLANAALTEEQAGWGTKNSNPAASDYSVCTNTKYAEIESPTAAFRTVKLVLDNSVAVRFSVELPSDITNITLRATNGLTDWVVPSDEFTYDAAAGRYVILFEELAAHQMDDQVLYTFYDGETAISNTFCYSIESYVGKNFNDLSASDPALLKVLVEMMDYGRSADSYD